jgi:hypothetical protein
LHPQTGERPPPRYASDGLSTERLGNRLDYNLTAQDSAQQIVAALDRLRLDYLSEALGFVASFATSAREAARRGTSELLRLHTGQARLGLEAALEVETELGLVETEQAA